MLRATEKKGPGPTGTHLFVQMLFRFAIAFSFSTAKSNVIAQLLYFWIYHHCCLLQTVQQSKILRVFVVTTCYNCQVDFCKMNPSCKKNIGHLFTGPILQCFPNTMHTPSTRDSIYINENRLENVSLSKKQNVLQQSQCSMKTPLTVTVRH